MAKTPARPAKPIDPKMIQVYSELVGRATLAAQLGLQYGGDRDIYQALGYETGAITYAKFAARYQRQDIAAAIINRPIDATWRGGFTLLESDDDKDTPLELAFADLYENLSLHSKFARLDRLAGIGKYGLLLLGLSDVRNVENFAQPVNGSALKLLWVKPFGEGSAPPTSIEYEADPSNERYGFPKIYTFTITSTADGSNQVIRVHHSRVLHVADGLLESEIEGTPRLEVVFNRLMDLEKLVGASAEMFWRGARPGHQAKIDKDATLTAAAQEGLQDMFDEYEHNLRRILFLEGVDMKELATQVADPEKHVLVQLQMISAVTQIPLRILLGSEVGELASTQDRSSWLAHVAGRRSEYAESQIIRPFVSRCIEYGVLPAPVEDYSVKWDDLWSISETDKAEIGAKRATAIKDYSTNPAAAMIIPPESFMRLCLGLDDEEIELVKEELEAALAEIPDDVELDPITKLPVPPEPAPADPNDPEKAEKASPDGSPG